MRMIARAACVITATRLIAACAGPDATHGEAVPPKASLVLSVDSLKFAKALPAPEAPSQTVAVATAGTGAITRLAAAVTYDAGRPWLTVTLASDKAPTTLTITPISTGLAIGAHYATVSVTSRDVSTGAPTLKVVHRVVPAAALKLSASTMSFYSAPNGTALPQTIGVIDTAGGITSLVTSVRYAAGQPVGWLAAVLDKVSAPATVTVQPATQALANGTYNATIDVLSQDASNSPRSVPVTVVVGPLPVLTVSPREMVFTPAGPNNGKPLSITDANGARLNGVRAEVTYPPGQPTGWVNAFETLSYWLVKVNAGAMTPAGRGTFTAIVTISVPGALNSPQQVIVTITI